MKPRYLKGVLVLLAIFLCSACASRSLVPPRCDLANAVPINVSEVLTGSSIPAAASAPDAIENAAQQGQPLEKEVRKP